MKAILTQSEALRFFFPSIYGIRILSFSISIALKEKNHNISFLPFLLFQYIVESFFFNHLDCGYVSLATGCNFTIGVKATSILAAELRTHSAVTPCYQAAKVWEILLYSSTS